MLNDSGSCVWQVRIDVEVEMPYCLRVDDNKESSRNLYSPLAHVSPCASYVIAG